MDLAWTCYGLGMDLIKTKPEQDPKKTPVNSVSNQAAENVKNNALPLKFFVIFV